jgi:CO/xanthine dehydrogenase FAD-binding subunit
MLFHSIPPFRLPKDVVRKQVKALEKMGIVFKTGVEVGKDITMAQLTKTFDTIFVAGGTWKALKLGVPGEDGEGVTYALDYLRVINSGKKVDLGARVIVVGGGSVAVDAARTAKRSGAEEVRLVCLECRDLSSKDRMLALDNEILEAEEEGIIIHDSLGVKEIALKDGKVTGLNTVNCLSVREPDGSFNPTLDMTCTALDLRADHVIVAIGQAVDPSLVPQGLSFSPRGTVHVDESGETGQAGIYGGGDMVAGAATVIQAVASARDGVRSMELKLGTAKARLKEAGAGFSDTRLREIPRAYLEELPVSMRQNRIDVEDMPGLGSRAIEQEAGRCVNCGCLAVGPSDVAVALVALDARIVTTKKSMAARAFFSASATSSTVLDKDELIKEIRIPKPGAGVRQVYEKFTLRKPIDFAIVSVAAVVTLKDGVCEDARIVLGSVAPEPLRARAAESYLKGRKVDEASAGKAAELALEGVRPLAMNPYKIEIARSLVKKAVMA